MPKNKKVPVFSAILKLIAASGVIGAILIIFLSILFALGLSQIDERRFLVEDE